MVLAIGEEHHGFVLAIVGIERTGRQPQRVADGGALCRYRTGTENIEEHIDRAVVGGQRTLDKGLAGEDHQPDPIPLEQIEQLADLVFGSGEAIGFGVLGGHAARHVEHQHHIDAFALRHFEFGSELWTRQRQNQK